MRHADRMTRDATITDCIRAVDAVLGDQPPGPQALAIIAALKALRDSTVRVPGTERVDYLSMVQRAAQDQHVRKYGPAVRDAAATAQAVVGTPIGALSATVWRVTWKNGKAAWFTQYTLAGEPITLREIKEAGLAQRPTTRRRKFTTRD